MRESKAAIEMDMYIILNKNTYLLCKYLSPCLWSDTVLAALFEGLKEGKREKKRSERSAVGNLRQPSA